LKVDDLTETSSQVRGPLVHLTLIFRRTIVFFEGTGGAAAPTEILIKEVN
jgi:hypothetical protein